MKTSKRYYRDKGNRLVYVSYINVPIGTGFAKYMIKKVMKLKDLRLLQRGVAHDNKVSVSKATAVYTILKQTQKCTAKMRVKRFKVLTKN